ncbi:OmpH family outer membrane protein [Bacteroidales bacterium OttesenSCG-928-C03]|nr:OmpH family outer membrane protein [Bacteroidales bacterium OttesenSCG-928-E04]MDL2309246.1 OmpH family outer membrane protein [Bacteroidales bacterium OttesenSCG-928-C03]MDL2326870.1 OmpH family outer membrane protein [Bacteroidales bacterium OttesenSCG-928-A14]
MKKIVLVAALFLTCAFSNTYAQQGKYGHVNSQEILKTMPGVDSIRIGFESFQAELEQVYEEYMTQYNSKVRKFEEEAGIMSQTIRQFREKEIMDLEKQIQEFQYSVQGLLEQKQMELTMPFQEKIQNAINAVAEENNFAYIFDTQILLYSDGGTDVTPMVKKKLGIK